MKAKYPLARGQDRRSRRSRQAGLVQRRRLAAAVAPVRGADGLAADGGQHPQEVLIRGRASVARPSPEGEVEAARGGARAAADGSRLPWNPPISRARAGARRRARAHPAEAAAVRPRSPRTSRRRPGCSTRSCAPPGPAGRPIGARPVPRANRRPGAALCRWLGLAGISGVADQGRGEAPCSAATSPGSMRCSTPGQRHPPPARIPEAGGVLAGPAVPGRQAARRTRPSSSAC